MVFEALQQGRLQLDTTFRVSQKAWGMGGSKMFLREGSRVKVEDLLRGVIVQSGNDACVVLAEGLAGSERAFAQLMTERGQRIGLKHSVFLNSTGWPAEGHVMSAEDLVYLARLIISEFPEYYHYFAQEEFTWDKIEQRNRNPLLGLGIGVDGLKTGHTEEAGFGLVGSAVQGDRRVVFAVSGLESTRERLIESERLVNWAFREFTRKTLFKAGETVTQAKLWLGAQNTVDLVYDNDVEVVIPYGEQPKVASRVIYTGPIEAPVQKGQEIAKLVIEVPKMGEISFPLKAAETVERGGFMARLNASAQVLTERFLGGDPIEER
jgi:D-alanyl-D-alanine carboxypeptidase (penicillin-binding protein 5/6)